MTQQGNGTTAQRLKRGKVTTIETIEAGQFAQRDEWHDIVAFMVEQGMLGADGDYGWTDYCRLRTGAHSPPTVGSGGGDGWQYQAWIRFGQIVGTARMNWLDELWDYPVPPANRPEQISFTRWRLNRSMHHVRDALNAAGKAAQEVKKEISCKQGEAVKP